MQKRFFLLLLVMLWCFSIPVLISGQTAQPPEKKQKHSFEEKPTGFYNVTSFTPVTFNGDLFNGFQTICGYKVIPQLAIGAGIGYEGFSSIPTYDYFKTDLSLLPVFIDIRYTALQGKVSPVVAFDAGYKFLLNRPTTQTIYDTSYYNVVTVSGRSDYADHDLYRSGGFFMTAGIGLKVRLYGRLSAYLAGEYSLWTVSGDRYSSEKSYLWGNDDNWSLVGSTETTDRTMAYVHVFQVRLGISL